MAQGNYIDDSPTVLVSLGPRLIFVHLQITRSELIIFTRWKPGSRQPIPCQCAVYPAWFRPRLTLHCISSVFFPIVVGELHGPGAVHIVGGPAVREILCVANNAWWKIALVSCWIFLVRKSQFRTVTIQDSKCSQVIRHSINKSGCAVC